MKFRLKLIRINLIALPNPFHLLQFLSECSTQIFNLTFGSPNIYPLQYYLTFEMMTTSL